MTVLSGETQTIAAALAGHNSGVCDGPALGWGIYFEAHWRPRTVRYTGHLISSSGTARGNRLRGLGGAPRVLYQRFRRALHPIRKPSRIIRQMAQTPLDHQTLFNRRLLERLVSNESIPEHHQQVLTEWAAAIRDGDIRRRGERQIRGTFINRFFVTLLGYQPFGSAPEFTLTEEARAGTGSADVALGRFSAQGDEVVAPVELKGPDTANLDVMMPGRHKSPVQQVWEYAMDVPGAKFLVLSNMLEIRLYAVGHTRRVYERFDLMEVAGNPREYRRLLLLIGADNLLTGRTARLLEESAQVEKEVTRQLYADYKNWRIQLIVALAHANDLSPGELIAPSQKLLDRVLFIAFAQQRGLLPANTLQEVHHSGSAWAPAPKYENYKGLFNVSVLPRHLEVIRPAGEDRIHGEHGGCDLVEGCGVCRSLAQRRRADRVHSRSNGDRLGAAPGVEPIELSRQAATGGAAAP